MKSKLVMFFAAMLIPFSLLSMALSENLNDLEAYLDQTGLANFVAAADKYAHLGAIYQVSEQTRKWAEEGRVFYKVEG